MFWIFISCHIWKREKPFDLILLVTRLASTTPCWSRINCKIEEKNIAIINKKKEEEGVCKSLNVDLWDAVCKQYNKNIFIQKQDKMWRKKWWKENQMNFIKPRQTLGAM